MIRIWSYHGPLMVYALWIMHIVCVLLCLAWFCMSRFYPYPLLWRHNGRDSVSNHQPHVCLFNSSFRRRSKKTSKLRVTGLCVGNSPVPVNSPHKGPVTRKMFPFDDVIMWHVNVDSPHRRPLICELGFFIWLTNSRVGGNFKRINAYMTW